MTHSFKLKILVIAAVVISLLELLSLLGHSIPYPFAFPFYTFLIIALGFQTLKEGFLALTHLNFTSINLLMVIAVFGALYLGEYPEAATVIILFTLAEHLEDIGIAKSQSALDKLLDQMPQTVLLKNSETPIAIKQVKINDKIIIKPSQFIPLDGVVSEGSSYVDESAITGESLAQDKRVGDLVFAGTWNQQGFLEITVQQTAENSTFQKIRELTVNADQNKAQTQTFIERFSKFYTPTILVLAGVWMLINWLLLGQTFENGFSAALVLLVIACPCALVISTPISIFSAIGNASSRGALVKGGKFLEAIGQIKALALDKTRTLTYGKPLVTDVIPFGDNSRERLLSCAAGIEALSEHPLAQSVVYAAQKEKLTPHTVENFESIMGKGAKAECLVCDTKEHCIGKLQFILEQHAVPPHVVSQIEHYQQQGKTVIVISTPKEVEGLIVVEDTVRQDSAQLIHQLHLLGIHTVMLTGDHQNVAQLVAKQLNIDDYKADLLPQDKVSVLTHLIHKYKYVGMFGDGINDAPALALSNVGISISSLGSDTALEVSSIILLNDRLDLIPFLIKLGRTTIRTIQFNTVLAVTVKLIFIILAFMGMTNLALAIFADVGTTLIVILISLRLLKWK